MVGAADNGDVALLAGRISDDGCALGSSEEGLVAFAWVVAAVGTEWRGVGVVDVAVGIWVVLGFEGRGIGHLHVSGDGGREGEKSGCKLHVGVYEVRVNRKLLLSRYNEGWLVLIVVLFCLIFEYRL
jgi:hypothetical protein